MCQNNSGVHSSIFHLSFDFNSTCQSSFSVLQSTWPSAKLKGRVDKDVWMISSLPRFALEKKKIIGQQFQSEAVFTLAVEQV